jgi:hypothetical protein
MPTKIYVDADSFIKESAASTARTADINWVSKEFVSHQSEERRGSLEGNNDLSLNDSTLSGSLLLDALQELESLRNQRIGDRKQKTPASSSPPLVGESETERTRGSKSTPSFRILKDSKEKAPSSILPSRKQPRMRTRQPGPNEREYMTTYHDFVQKAIGNYNRDGKYPNYQDMDEASKDTERIFVLGLLKRLNIQDVPHSSFTDDMSVASILRPIVDDSLHDLDETHDPTKSPEKLSPNLLHNDHPSKSYPMHSATRPSLTKSPPDKNDCGSIRSETESPPIEIARSKAPFESPVLVYHGQKRTATSSGKKGADVARTRHGRPSEIFGELNMYDQPSEIAAASFHELSLSDGNNFLNSDSPMSQHSSILLNLSTASSPFLHDNDSDDEPLDESLRELSSQKTTLNRGKRVLREISLNPSLKEGKNMQYKPLQVNFEKKGKGRCLTQSIPNSFDGYRNSTKQKLLRLVKWIRKQDTQLHGKGLILSLSEQQIIDVILNILSDYCPNEGSQRDKVGETLIVLRAKEDVETWCRALREGSSLSVLNHPEMPRSERISPNIAIAKLASYSVIITTFDALKAGDATIVCDGKGVAVISQSSSQSEWQKAGSCDRLRQCKEMSLIHHLKWQRVFFVDALGKKSYLVKGGTARVTSAKAINSDSR